MKMKLNVWGTPLKKPVKKEKANRGDYWLFTLTRKQKQKIRKNKRDSKMSDEERKRRKQASIDDKARILGMKLDKEYKDIVTP